MYSPNDYRDYLMHYGIKGMKWHQHLFGDDDENRSGNRHNFVTGAGETFRRRISSSRQTSRRSGRSHGNFTSSISDKLHQVSIQRRVESMTKALAAYKANHSSKNKAVKEKVNGLLGSGNVANRLAKALTGSGSKNGLAGGFSKLKKK